MPQIFYKTFRRERFEPGSIKDTATYNYGLVTASNKQEARLFERVVKWSEHGGFGPLLAGALRASDIDLTATSLGPARRDELLDLGRRSGLAVDALTATKFWEYLYESVRAEVAPDRPRRTSSIFACHSLDAVQRYSTTHARGEVLGRIELLEGTTFDADMALLDSVEVSWTASRARPVIESYWKGEFSSDPLPEVLIQGRFRMLSLD